jgi:peptidyl-prolyl cis-trans isomerase SurA
MQEHLTFRPAFTAALRAAIFTGALLAAPAVAAAQGLFSPAITVDDDVITNFELEQRAMFIRLIGSPGDAFEQAEKALIEDRLKMRAMEDAGITVSEEDILAGMEELAARANLTLDDFLNALSKEGVAPQTMRDYTIAGLGWREFVGARFLSQARPSDEEIDRAMGSTGNGSIEVLLSELLMPINAQNAPQVQDIASQVTQLSDYDSFSAAATQFSASNSRQNGGKLPWLPLGKLPPALQEVVLSLDPGEVTSPIALQGAVALFQMRGIREAAAAAPRYAAIEYAAYRVPGGRSPEGLKTAEKVVARVDTCADFYPLALGQSPEVLEKVSLPPAEIPKDIALELAKLDPGETSTAVTRDNGQTLLVLMLCGRTAELAEDASRETVANALTQQRLAALADSYVAQLKAESIISRK